MVCCRGFPPEIEAINTPNNQMFDSKIHVPLPVMFGIQDFLSIVAAFQNIK